MVEYDEFVNLFVVWPTRSEVNVTGTHTLKTVSDQYLNNRITEWFTWWVDGPCWFFFCHNQAQNGTYYENGATVPRSFKLYKVFRWRFIFLGPLGEVHRGQHLKNCFRSISLKLLLPGLSNSPEQVGMIHRLSGLFLGLLGHIMSSLHGTKVRKKCSNLYLMNCSI